MNPDFLQQGQICWVDLSRITVNISLGIFSRLSAVSTNRNTVAAGHFIERSFKLSRKGAENTGSAFSNLNALEALVKSSDPGPA